MKLENILKIVILIVAIICGYFFIRLFMVGDDAIETDKSLQDSIISPFLVVAYIILAFTVIVTLFFSIMNLLKNPAVLKRSLIGIGVFLAIVIVSYLLATGETTTLSDGQTLSESGTKWVSAGLTTFYFLIVIAVGLILATGIRKAIK